VSKTRQRKLEESPVAGSLIHV